MEPRIWKTGEPCQITCGGRTVEGKITLASPNGQSLAIEFEAFLDPAGSSSSSSSSSAGYAGYAGYAGAMGLLWNGSGFEDLFGRGVVELSDIPK